MRKLQSNAVPTEGSLVQIVQSLPSDGYILGTPDTIRHLIKREYKKDDVLSTAFFYSGHTPVYALNDDGDPILYMLPFHDSPLFQRLREKGEKFQENDFKLSRKELQKLISGTGAKAIDAMGFLPRNLNDRVSKLSYYVMDFLEDAPQQTQNMVQGVLSPGQSLKGMIDLYIDRRIPKLRIILPNYHEFFGGDYRGEGIMRITQISGIDHGLTVDITQKMLNYDEMVALVVGPKTGSLKHLEDTRHGVDIAIEHGPKLKTVKRDYSYVSKNKRTGKFMPGTGVRRSERLSEEHRKVGDHLQYLREEMQRSALGLTREGATVLAQAVYLYVGHYETAKPSKAAAQYAQLYDAKKTTFAEDPGADAAVAYINDNFQQVIENLGPSRATTLIRVLRKYVNRDRTINRKLTLARKRM
ncbi:hypothetical protein J4227_07145 [Candidatus Woesearchaeota archaeon]|nr:hypothetical protein [Candidatus Woesearchaeota archaeon]